MENEDERDLMNNQLQRSPNNDVVRLQGKGAIITNTSHKLTG